MTMSRYEALARRLGLVLGLGVGTAACEGNGPLANDPPAAAAPAPVTSVVTTAPPPPARAALEAEAAADLAHLRALQIVEVGQLVLDLPDAASACYGPCSDDLWAFIVTAEYRRQVPRLTALVRAADDAVLNPRAYPYPMIPTYASQDVDALNGLEIVDLGALLVAQPANNPRCYNTPCSEDVQSATTETGFRAFYLHAWASQAVVGEKL
jgi:hypothetical protein